MDLNTFHFLGHWWVLLIGILFIIRSVFSMVENDIKGWHLGIWIIVCALAVTLTIIATIEMEGPSKAMVTTNQSSTK